MPEGRRPRSVVLHHVECAIFVPKALAARPPVHHPGAREGSGRDRAPVAPRVCRPKGSGCAQKQPKSAHLRPKGAPNAPRAAVLGSRHWPKAHQWRLRDGDRGPQILPKRPGSARQTAAADGRRYTAPGAGRRDAETGPTSKTPAKPSSFAIGVCGSKPGPREHRLDRPPRLGVDATSTRAGWRWSPPAWGVKRQDNEDPYIYMVDIYMVAALRPRRAPGRPSAPKLELVPQEEHGRVHGDETQPDDILRVHHGESDSARCPTAARKTPWPEGSRVCRR